MAPDGGGGGVVVVVVVLVVSTGQGRQTLSACKRNR